MLNWKRIRKRLLPKPATAFDAVAVANAPVKLCVVEYEQLDVTSGSLDCGDGIVLRTESPTFRTTMRRNIDASAACLRFRYLGPTTETSYFGTRSTTWRQIGLKLFEANPCNVVYVMWRIERPEDLSREREQLIIRIKSNPTMQRFSQCKHHGYSTLAQWYPAASARDSREHTLHAEVAVINSRTMLRIRIDEREEFETVCPDETLATTRGTTGIRSDNGRFDLRYYVAE